MTSLALTTAGGPDATACTPCPTYDLRKQPEPLLRQILRHVSLYSSLAVFNIACSIAATALAGSWVNSHLLHTSSPKAAIASAPEYPTRP